MNVGLGYLALANNTTGSFNAAIGYGALYSNTTGVDNVAIGDSNLVDNTTGSYNVALGAGSLINNTTGNDNIGIGWLSLGSNLTGSDNIAIGNGALENATNVSNAIAIGEEAFHNLSNNVYDTIYPGYGGATPSTGIAIGHQAMYSALVTDGEIAIGDYALYSAATPSYSIAIGAKALYSAIGSFPASVAVGDGALWRQTTGWNNTVLGSAGYKITTGSNNNIFGGYTGDSLTTGWGNNIFGGGDGITTGNNNIAMGSAMSYKAYQWDGTSLNAYGFPVTTDATPHTGYQNIGIGNGALNHNIAGNYNIAIGAQSMAGGTGSSIQYFNNIATPSYEAYPNTGYNNIAIGTSTLYKNTSGQHNIAQGSQALYNNSNGGYNIAQGFEALYNSTSGDLNIGQGYRVLYNVTGAYNIGIGIEALYSTTNGYHNIALGYQSLYSNTGGAFGGPYTYGQYNIGIGYFSLKDNTTGAYNTGVGYLAGQTATTGSNNTYLGANAQPASVTDSNKITLGDSNITHLRCQVTSITALSDARDKTGIQDSVYGLEFINKLRPVTFEWNMRDGGKAGQKDLGFLAQDFVELEDELDAHEILNLTMRSNPDKLEASYGRLVPILVKAVQDLSAEVQSLKQLLESKE
jgi:hypothetical protein